MWWSPVFSFPTVSLHDLAQRALRYVGQNFAVKCVLEEFLDRHGEGVDCAQTVRGYEDLVGFAEVVVALVDGHDLAVALCAFGFHGCGGGGMYGLDWYCFVDVYWSNEFCVSESIDQGLVSSRLVLVFAHATVRQ